MLILVLNNMGFSCSAIVYNAATLSVKHTHTHYPSHAHSHAGCCVPLKSKQRKSEAKQSWRLVLKPSMIFGPARIKNRTRREHLCLWLRFWPRQCERFFCLCCLFLPFCQLANFSLILAPLTPKHFQKKRVLNPLSHISFNTQIEAGNTFKGQREKFDDITKKYED